MSALPWILGGGTVALGAYLWTRRDQDSTGDAAIATGPLPGRWVWPVGVWMGRKPEISDGFQGTRRSPSGERRRHGGVDILYRRIASDPWKAGTTNASRHYVMPPHRAALAASDGRVWSASYTPRGWSVVIDHSPRKLATYYTHLSQLLVVPKQTVRAGQPIGVIGADPLDPARLMHRHFEVWRGGSADRFDPAPAMKAWEYLPDPGDLPAALVARNARIANRPGDLVRVRQHTRSYPRR